MSMPLDQESKDFIVKTVSMFNKDLIKQINKSFEHVSKRFDDVERRLESIESRLNIMNKDTKIIPKIFSILEEDGVDIAKLTARVDRIDSNQN